MSFLCRSEELASQIVYSADKRDWRNHKVVIIPSGFFTSPNYLREDCLPQEPFPLLDGTPILFGKPIVHKYRTTVVIEADLVASAFFILSRYEELVNPCRDYLKRFLSRHSILSQYHTRCIVEEYGKILRDALRFSGLSFETQCPELKVVMTHDADKIEQYQNLRGFVGGIIRGHGYTALKSAVLGVEYDPLFTFPYMQSVEQKAPNVKTLLFVKTGGKKLREDKPCYNPNSRAMQKMMAYYDNIGLHLSLQSGQNMIYALREKEKLEKATGRTITANRNHYLASLKPRDLLKLSAIGISDDYTMGFADRAGFRLGTCRPVKYIDAKSMRLSKLTLHPLCIMDRTLNSPRYMNLNYNEAFALCNNLYLEALKYGGEFVMLWHNNSLSRLDNSYLKKLYENVLSHEFLIREK